MVVIFILCEQRPICRVIYRRNKGTLHTLPKPPPFADGGSCTAVGNLLLAIGLFEGATLST